MSYNYRTISNCPEERQRVTYPYCFWEDAFTSDEIDKICKLMSSIPMDNAYISSADENIEVPHIIPVAAINKNVRRSTVSFHTPNNENQWIFDRLNNVIEHMNNKWYNFDINGYNFFQYTEYHEEEQGCYGWHNDLFLGFQPKEAPTETRKLSLTMLLTEPDEEFEGGQLQFGHELRSESAPMKKGSIVLFPSWALHQVAPVTKGVRKSIVVWVLGPKWK
jgi:PKHD-type hydroxylase